ncbi:hypothetical protein KC909_00705 [Candidatus Dojkabacteria bacterium]|uniref:Transcription regulator TrmB N-terminal domain-containing protein n=1 Tax=Candidatus Dojkabacteria bacterium TaxID=2099670 RepID=A0A955RIZ1_9BACT|nr:hypothetical protein [Candidatus Dojkabacteria bacterium]
MNDILTKFGLTENESQIYQGLISNPLCTAAKIARILNMDKSSAYKAVDSLKSKGLLIGYGGETGLEYRAADPDSLLGLYSEKKAELDNNKQSLTAFIDNLKTDAVKYRNTLITVESGINAVQKRMRESLHSKEKLIRERFRSHTLFDNKEHVEFVKRYAEQRRLKKIFIRQLEVDFDFMNSRFKDIMTKHKKYLKEVRLLPRELDNNNSLRIWDDTVNIVSYSDNDEFIIVTIKDKYLSELMKNMYDFIWERTTKYTPQKT